MGKYCVLKKAFALINKITEWIDKVLAEMFIEIRFPCRGFPSIECKNLCAFESSFGRWINQITFRLGWDILKRLDELNIHFPVVLLI